MNEAILMNPNINEGTEINDITHHTFQLLADFKLRYPVHLDGEQVHQKNHENHDLV